MTAPRPLALRSLPICCITARDEGAKTGSRILVQKIYRDGTPKPRRIRARSCAVLWWRQTKRVELNAMTTPELIAWLDRKMEEHGAVKLIPPRQVIADEFEQKLTHAVATAVTERILRDAKSGRCVVVIVFRPFCMAHSSVMAGKICSVRQHGNQSERNCAALARVRPALFAVENWS
jgi:hypothetical protein